MAGLSSLFQSMFDTLTPSFLRSLGFLFGGVEGEAQKLKSTLSRIEALLNDAEDRQIREESVRLWLRELKDAAYDAEDIVDEVECQVLRSKIEGAQMQTRKRKLTDQVSDLFSSSVSNLNMGPRIKEIRKRLEEIESRSNHFHLKVMLKSEMLIPGKRLPTSSSIDESIVFGRENDKAKVVHLLTSDGDSSAAYSGIEVVPICGMGGLGKTTLAQLAYNDERVKEHFDVRAWVYVSEDFDLIRITNAIVKSVTRSDPHLSDSDPYQVSIEEALKEKRFLLVLDDVWHENCNDWDALRAPLMVGARGSRILVTTRSKRVSSNIGTVPTHFLQGLSDDDGWSLFERRAFVQGDSDAHPDLVKIGKEIVKKCNGLALAVKTLGGLLRAVVDVVQWEAILKSEIWDLPEERNDILPALRLSYHHLPAHLKRCFAYCACVINRGGSGVEGNELILRWMAQGFIQPKGSTSEQMEDIGREYLADLVSRSLLNKFSSSSYTMHGLTHDFARSVLGADFWKIGDENFHGNNAEKARYMSHSFLESCSNFEYFCCLKNLRTLSLSYTGNIPADLFIKLRHIRTLQLSGGLFTGLPESIGDLLQLRYLDLSNSDIERLPKSTTRLYNLQTLRLDYCSKLVELPSDLSNLVKLRHLHLNVLTQSTVSIPPRIGTLKGLRTLSHFNVGKEIGRGVNELKDLIHLRGRLRISELENVVNVEEAKEAQLKNKQKIEDLELRWKCDDVESWQDGIEEEVLNALQPSTNLKRLEIEGYCGVRFPTWLGDSSFSNLTKVCMWQCRCHLLPPFGRLPSLKSLSLSYLYGLKKVGHEFYGDGTMTGFPPLDKLSFDSMPDLEELSGLESDIRHICAIDISNCTKLSLSSLRYLTSLSSLRINNYSNLTSLGNGLQHLTSLQSLEIAGCPELTSLYDGFGNSNYSNLTCLPKGLKRLALSGCPKIRSLPEELLTTLRSLYIERCPLLEEKYLVLAGGNGYRCKISDIPNITFAGYYPKKEEEINCADGSLNWATADGVSYSPSPNPSLSLPLNLPASVASITSSYDNHPEASSYSPGTGAMDSAISKVADAGLSSLFEAMFDTLTPSFLQSLFGVEGDAQKLKSTLSRIQALLNDAEDRQIREEPVRLWLRELKDAAYDAEDIVDEVECQVLRSKIEGAQMQTRKRKWTDQVSDLYSSSVSNLNMGPRIKEIRERLEEIESRSNHLHLKEMLKSEMLIPGKRHPTSSIIDESIVFGRETDREKVVGLLTSDGDSSAANSGIQVIPICGMGGLGKTTLAQLAYNDERVEKHFEVKVWVYVSEDFDLIKLTKAIAESVSGSDPHVTNLDAIQVSMKEALKEKKFLLVLDDVWTENFDDWHKLWAPLMFGARGSRILVTTRSERVSSNMGTVPTHFLQGLSDDDCWSLFERRAFVEGDSDAHPDLVKIGKEIVKKCNGLALAVKTLGGLLRSQVDVVEWEAILKSEIWDLPEERNDILPALRLSYRHLPAHLKRCFAYCCIFNKGCNMVADGLVWMWMAQGFIQPKRSSSEQMEDIGKEYLADLVSRSLLHYDDSFYRMHDLIHDLARSVSGDDILKVGDFRADTLEVGDLKSLINAEKVRHVSCRLSRSSVESVNFKDLYCLKSLRTLRLPRYNWIDVRRYPVLTIPPDFFVNLRHIRILDLSRNHITELPESVGNLIQLRYLDLSWTMIERLPKSITRLYNLQTLMLAYCSKLVEVPSDFSNLVNLRKIILEGCSASIPFGGLKSLQDLEHFKVGREVGYRVNGLSNMIHLRGSLRISELENVISVEEAKEAELKNKQKINHLKLEWESHGVDSGQEELEEKVLNALQPHTNLEDLEIKGYYGVRFPTWLGDSSFSKLVSISLVTCKCCVLPPFGQLPSLKYLSLEKLYGLEKVGREVYGDGMVKGFPSLKTLHIWSMPDLEEWSALEGDFIHVSEIDIRSCSKLRVLPDIFPFTLESVEIFQCEKLATLPRISTIRHLCLSSCGEQILRSLQYLTSLSSLNISGFPTLTSLPNRLLQPLTLLKKLSINACDKLISLSEEVGLQHLTSLKSLEIWNCPQLTSLGDEVLPATLHHLEFVECSNLNRLPTGLNNVTSLTKLVLVSCHKIHSLPEELPTTLDTLVIDDCPLVTEKCQEGGEYWSKISYIPSIEIDHLFGM